MYFLSYHCCFYSEKQFHGGLVRLHCVWRWMPCLYVALASKAGAVCRNALPLVPSVWEEQRRLVLRRLDVHSWPISVLLSRLHFCNFSLFLSTEVACNNKLFIFLEENNRISHKTDFYFFYFFKGSFEQEGRTRISDEMPHEILYFVLLHECQRAARGTLCLGTRLWMRERSPSCWVWDNKRLFLVYQDRFW